ncbi:MAG: hypothetical protein ACYDB7_13175 [Mycobacteriales bacterium]
MRKRIIFGTGFAAGYLLGARAGRQRYDAIMRTLRSLAERPEAQEAAGVLQAQAGTLFRGVRDRIGSWKAVADDMPAPYPSANGRGH